MGTVTILHALDPETLRATTEAIAGPFSANAARALLEAAGLSAEDAELEDWAELDDFDEAERKNHALLWCASRESWDLDKTIFHLAAIGDVAGEWARPLRTFLRPENHERPAVLLDDSGLRWLAYPDASLAGSDVLAQLKDPAVRERIVRRPQGFFGRLFADKSADTYWASWYAGDHTWIKWCNAIAAVEHCAEHGRVLGYQMG